MFDFFNCEKQIAQQPHFSLQILARSATEYPWIVTEYFSLWRPRCVLGKAQGVQPGKFRGHFNFTKKSGDELLQMGQAPGKKLDSWNICEYFAKTAAENEAKSLNNYFSLLLIWFWTHTRRLSSRLIMPHFWRTFSRAVVPFTHNFSLFFLIYGSAWRCQSVLHNS